MGKIFKIKNILFLFLYLFFSLNQVNAQSSCNDSIISSTSCYLSSNTYTFYSQQSANGFWWVYDSSGSQLTSNPNASSISFNFINQGSYEIRFLDFASGCTYSNFIYVTDIPISLSVNNSTTICSGGSIDYDSLVINTTNNSGNINYSWVTSPNSFSWEGLIPFSIPSSENSVILTVTDILTGCSDSENININYYSTTANPFFNISTGQISCPGQNITCTANYINNSLYSYQWSIDGISQNNGFTGVLNSSIFPIDSVVSISLYVEDLSNGCIVSSTQLVNANNPQYAALDTSASHYNQELNSFVYCESDSAITDTLNNPFNILNGVDSVVIDLGVGGTQTYTTIEGFDQFFLNLSESTYSATLTTYFNGTCLPVSVSYNFLYNQQLNSVNVNFGTCASSNLCIGDTVNYLIDPQQFQMPLNAEILWVISCDSNNVDTVIWDYYDVQNNTYFTDADCNPSTADEEYIVFKYLYAESSCGCYFNDNTIGDIYDKFRIIPIFVTACQSNAMTLGLTVYVPPIPTAELTIIDSVCIPATVTMFNNSDFGCQNSINPNYSSSNAPYGLLNPTFYYNFGNCVDSINVPTQNQYLSNSFQTISNTYSNAGIYHIELSASNSCTSISFNDSISIFPKPNVSFISDTICQGTITKFISSTSTKLATTDTIICFPNNKIINVPAGLPISSFSWSMGSNQGSYENGTSSSSENPEFIFNTCGENIVGLTVTDSLGCDSTYYSSVFVYGSPNADFNFNNFECVGNPTCITDLSTANQNPNCYLGQLDLWQWIIKDENDTIVYSNTSSISNNFCDTLIPICNPSIISSDYEIKLIITDQKGCIDSSVQVNTIFCNPQANFDNSGVCFDSINGGIKNFINLSSPQNGVSFIWYFGDGDSSTTINPTHTYNDTGSYNVTLILLGNNCNDTIVKTVGVFDEYLVNLTADTILCYSQNTGFINTIPIGGFSPYNYLWNGPNSYSSSSQNINNLYTGLYSVVVTDNNGCITNDSIYIAENQLITGSSNFDTCDIYIWGNQSITVSGNYNQTFTNTAGCDSLHTLNVIIRESFDDTSYITTCDSYSWNGIIYTSSGFYSNTYSRTNGCDSIITINLNIVSSDSVNSSVSACESYQWNSQTITISGNYNQTFINSAGCDSVHTLTVIVENANLGLSSIDTCDIYIWNNQTITSSGNYNQTFTNTAGCDSVHTLNVIIKESFNDTTYITTCDSYTWDGITYTSSGFYSNIYSRINSCDSIVGIDLTINRSSIAEIGVMGSLINCAPLHIDSSLIVAVDSINDINNFYYWTINHSNGNSVNGTGIYPPIDSIINENDSAEIFLFVNNNYGCNSDSTSIIIKTYINPIVNFSLDTLQGCSPLTINTDTSGTTQGGSYIWRVLNQSGTILETYNYHKSNFVLNNSSNTIDSSYYITLLVVDNQSCEKILSSNEIIVFARPISEFLLQNVCDENDVSFLDNSTSATSTITSWQWDFGDIYSSNDTSTLQNPSSYIFSTWGIWSVTLIISDNKQCIDTSYQYINIYPNPISNFTSNFNCETDLLCSNTLLSFNDSSYVDSFGGVITNEYWYIDNIFADSSLYTQTFNTQLDTGISNIKHIVKTQYGCLDTIAIDFEVVEIPNAGFFIADTVCGKDSSLIELVNLSNGNIINSVLEISNSLDSIILIDTISSDSIVNYIDLSSSNDVITYYLTLTVSNCCGASIYTDSIVILPNPQVYFVTNPICNLTPIPINNPVYLFFSNFVDTINTDSVIINWGDGTNSGIIFPNLDGGSPVWPDLIHSYSIVNIYNICITGYNHCDSTTYCCDLEVIPNQINSDFQLIDKLACQDENCGIKVRELSSPGFNNATVNWWFDYDPNNPPYYPNLGSPDLSIAYSQFDTICWQYNNPGKYFIFHEISSGQVGGPNGPTFTDTSFNLLDTVIVFPKPEINFTSADICRYDTLKFINNSTIDNTIQGIPNQSINSWQWYINGVAINSSWDLSYSFNTIGTHWIKLEAISNYNCTNSDSVEITIYDLPEGNFSSNPVCENNIMSFIDSSLGVNFPITSWKWLINGGVYQNSNQNSQNPNFLFDNCSSNKLVSLEITDSFGCSNSFSKNVEIFCNPIADLSVNSPLCQNNIISFKDQSIGVSEIIIDWSWNFGINATPQFSSLQNDSTSYSQNTGIQNIQFTVTDSNNCSSTIDTLIYINNNPTAIFNWNNICANESTTFTNNSISQTNQINSFYWQFSDGGFSLLENPIYIFSVNDTIGSLAWATLQITDIAGCKDTFDSRSTGKDIEIHPLPNINFTADAVCEGEKFTFINNSSINNLFNDSLSFPNPVWSFDNGAVFSNDSIWFLNTTNPLYLPGIYNLELNMLSSFISESTNQKCFSSLNKNIEILVVPSINPDTSWTNSQCGTDVEFTFNGNPENVNTYYYSIEDIYNNPPAITSTHEFTYKFDYPGTFKFNQYIYNQNGCYDSLVDYLKVYPKPIADFQTNKLSGCENLKIDFTDLSVIEFDSLFDNGSAQIVSWNWIFDDNGVSSDSYTENTYNTINGEISYYSPSLYVETNHGCSDYIQKINNIITHPTPIAKITTPILELGPGLYNFNASESETSNGLLIDPELFNFIWITNNDTLWDYIKNVNLDFQYPPNTNYLNSDFQTYYDLCLILIDENSQFQCVDTFCLEPRLFVNYFKGLYVPNALAPDDKSGQTSYFLPKGQSLEEYNLEIFDTWGNLVWQSDKLTEFDKKPAIPWHGETLDNKPLPQGTYLWKIYAKFTDGSIWQGINGNTTGPIYLIR